MWQNAMLDKTGATDLLFGTEASCAAEYCGWQQRSSAATHAARRSSVRHQRLCGRDTPRGRAGGGRSFNASRRPSKTNRRFDGSATWRKDTEKMQKFVEMWGQKGDLLGVSGLIDSVCRLYRRTTEKSSCHQRGAILSICKNDTNVEKELKLGV